jgi:hypothetical protein
MSVSDKLFAIERKLKKLKERRKKIEIQEALLFFKEVKTIFKKGFYPELALRILAQTCEIASEIQKQEEKS